MSDSIAFKMLISAIITLLKNNANITGRLLMYYFDVEKLISPFMESDSPYDQRQSIEVIGSLLISEESKIT